MAPRPERGLFSGWILAPAPEPDTIPLTLRHPEPGLVAWRRFDPPMVPAWIGFDLAYPAEGMVDARLAFRFADGTRLPQRLAKVGRNSFSGLFRPAQPLAGIELHLSGSVPLDAPVALALRPVPAWERRLALARRALGVLRGDPRSFPWRAARFLVQVRRQGRTTIPLSEAPLSPEAAYRLWQDRFDERDSDEALHRRRAAALVGGPRFTILAGPDFDAGGIAALRDGLDRQVYSDWDLVIATGRDGAPPPDEAAARATGGFVLLPRPGTRLRPHALLVLAAAVLRHPAAQLLYADDDDAGPHGRSDPRFKPAWSPTRLHAGPYIGDLCCIAKASLLGAGALTEAPDWRHAMMLRLAGHLRPEAVVHVAQVLSHAAPGAPRVPRRHVVEAVAEPPLVSLIIPTRDRADLLRVAVDSIRARTAYRAYEIIVVDNGSVEAETLRLFESWAGDPEIRVLPDPNPFNYAALNNRAVASARGTLIGLVNNDIEAIDPGWLGEMVGWALRPGIGCVGAKLYYPDGRLQHGGVVTGIGGAAGHRGKRSPKGAPGMLDDLLTVNEVSAVTAACLLVRKSVYEKVGGLDAESFAVAYNDVDFCLKVAAAGYRNLFTPFAELIHHESVSRGRDLSPRAAERFNAENLALRLRWGERLLDDPYYSPNLTTETESGAVRTQ